MDHSALRRWGHTATALSPTSVAVFGGFGAEPVNTAAAGSGVRGDGRLNSLAVLDAATGVWQRLPVAGSAVPAAREQHSAVLWQPTAAAAAAPTAASAPAEQKVAAPSSAAASQKGKISRYLAAKAALGVRADALRDDCAAASIFAHIADRQLRLAQRLDAAATAAAAPESSSSSSASRLLVFGGRTNPHNALGDVWSFDPRAGAWTSLPVDPVVSGAPAHTPPPALYRHCAALYGQRMVVFGGRMSVPAATTAAAASISAATTPAAFANSSADSKGDAAPAALPRTRLLCGDTYALDLSPLSTAVASGGTCTPLQWARLATTGTGPSPRSGHAAVLVGNKWYVHGGVEAGGVHPVDAALYCLDLDALVWSTVPTTGSPPPPLYSHTASVVPVTASTGAVTPHLLLVGGASGANALHHTQLYALNLAAATWYQPALTSAATDAADTKAADVKSAAPSQPPGFVPAALCVKHRTCVLPPSATPTPTPTVLVLGGGMNCFSFGTTFNATLAFRVAATADALALVHHTFAAPPAADATASAAAPAASAPAAAAAPVYRKAKPKRTPNTSKPAASAAAAPKPAKPAGLDFDSSDLGCFE